MDLTAAVSLVLSSVFVVVFAAVLAAMVWAGQKTLEYESNLKARDNKIGILESNVNMLLRMSNIPVSKDGITITAGGDTNIGGDAIGGNKTTQTSNR